MPGSFSIFTKGLILVSVPLLFQLTLIGLFADLQWRNAEAQALSLHGKEVLRQAQGVFTKLVIAETAERGLVITENAAFAASYENDARSVPGDLQRLQDLVKDDPNQEARAERIAVKALAFLAWHTDVIELVRVGDPANAVARIKTLHGKRNMDDLRGEVDGFLAEEERLDGERRLTLDSSQRKLNWFLAAGAGLALFVSVVTAFVFSRGISGRLATLTENAQRLAQGKELAKPILGTDEIARLDQAFRKTARDLTLAQEAMQKQTQILQSVIDSMGDGVVVADEKGKFLVWNPAAERIIGAGPTAGSIDGPRSYTCFFPDRATPFPIDDLPLARAVRGVATDNVEVFIRHPNSTEGAWVVFTGRPLQDEQGLPRGGVVVLHNISERKRAEEQVRRLNEELEDRVRERTAELVEINRDLAAKNQENEMFVYSVSHDLRSPLVNLQGFSKELGKGCQALRAILSDESLPSDLRQRGLVLMDGNMTKAMGFIQTAVLRVSSIIDALLRLSRAGRVKYQWQHVDVGRLVAGVLDSVHGDVAERKVAVVIGDLPPIQGDPAALEQVFANLIGNALKYLDPKRPGMIEIGRRDAEPQEGQERLITYYVKDNGLGIAQAYQEKAFQVFQRVHPGVASGEGMGLAIVRRVVERHDGRVWVESRVGEGSTFFVALPSRPANNRPRPSGQVAIAAHRERMATI